MSPTIKPDPQFPFDVERVETAWIEMADGCRLACTLWLPEGAERAPVPAVVELHPYRRRDASRLGDNARMGYLAGHGYACVRVDLRGSGDSEGVLRDEYLEREIQDGLEVLKWIAAQSWCSGKVGIVGLSWSGFNGLQIAARRPPELAALVSLCSTDDRYTDDVHYMGGCLLGDNLSWASVMFSFNSLPPDPEVVGERWRTMWLERLEKSGLWLETWLRHPHRDAYWKHGSICEDYDAIEVPVMLASGWADGYSNSIFRMLSRLKVPRWGLIGPWSHAYPHTGLPGPAIGFMQELVRWFDHWMKGEDGGLNDDPMLRVWMQDSVPPHSKYDVRPGRWVAETAWPSSRIEQRVLRIGPGRLVAADKPEPEAERFSIRSPLSVGSHAGKWCSYSAPPDLPHDQREEDGGALTFQTRRLKEPVEILGAVELELELSIDQPVGMVAARLSDVAVDGEATRITYGLLNLTHRDGHEAPAALVPNQRYRVRLRFNDVAQHFPAGHRIRLSLSTSYFPLAWPPPNKTMLTVYSDGSRLILPVRPPRPEDAELRRYAEPRVAPSGPVTGLRADQSEWIVRRDLARDKTQLEVLKDEGRIRYDDIGLELDSETREIYGYRRGDFDSVKGEVTTTTTMRRGAWKVRTDNRTVLTSTSTEFRVYATLDAFENDRRVFASTWHETIERDLV